MPAGKGKGKSRGSIGRNRSRSRNTTPASVFDFPSSDHADGGPAAIVPSYNEIIDKYITGLGASSDSASNGGNGSSLNSNAIPTSAQLQQLTQDLKAIAMAAKSRSQASDHMALRMTTKLVKRREEEKERAEKEAREKSIQDRDERERRRQRSDSTDRRSEKLKDRDKDRRRRDSSASRPHALGAHQATSQAPSNVVVKEESTEGRSNIKKRKASGSDGEESDYSQAGSTKKEEEDEVSDDGQPPPMPPVIVYQELDDDPSVYEIGAVTPETTVEEKKKIYSVAMFPMKDITHLLPGDPPDEDFSRAKPTNQVAMNTFTAYIEPYFRPYNEEDMAFLRERGDRVTPYIIPALGRHYLEAWAEEDGNRPSENSSLPENTPRGNPDDLSDNVLETSQVSLGPLLSRVMAGLMSEETDEQQQQQEQQAAANGGDVAMGNAGGTSGTAEPSQTQDSSQQPTQSSSGSNAKDQSAASNIPLPEGHIQPKDWKVQANRPDYATVEERIRQELVYMGLVAPSDTFHFQDRQDDEVSARLRQLQAELRAVSVRNGARKARLTELLKEQLAYQEYSTILDDLDKQVDQAYLKRTRGMKAKKKRAGPNGHVNAGAARPGIGDVAKTVMERRKKWSDTIGPVFDKTVTLIPKETIFDPAVMAVLEAKEAAGDAELDDE